ncbi:hypothetical protein ZWY2020_014519 [Hordeum vulgare]|nr:hypothetical protein ZWY2020_014519 [Hordeum vulgare]
MGGGGAKGRGGGCTTIPAVATATTPDDLAFTFFDRRAALEQVHGFQLGDRTNEWKKKKWADFQQRLSKLLTLQEPWTLIIDDALAASFVAPATNLIEDDIQLLTACHLATDAGKEIANKVGFVYQLNISPKVRMESPSPYFYPWNPSGLRYGYRRWALTRRSSSWTSGRASSPQVSIRLVRVLTSDIGSSSMGGGRAKGRGGGCTTIPAVATATTPDDLAFTFFDRRAGKAGAQDDLFTLSHLGLGMVVFFQGGASSPFMSAAHGLHNRRSQAGEIMVLMHLTALYRKFYFGAAALERVHGFQLGDSTNEWKKKKWADFQQRLSKLLTLQEPWTLIIDDALAASFVAPATNLIEDDIQLLNYERSWEQNEELGLNDMDSSSADIAYNTTSTE